MKTTLLISRHGNTFGPGDVVTRVGGRTDLPLVDSGLEQGRQLGRYLKQQDLLPHVIYTSRLQRTIQTAQMAQEEMGTTITAQPVAIFNEIDYGPDENRPEEEVVARIGKDALDAWDKDAVVPPGWVVDPQAIVRDWTAFGDMLLRDHKGQTVLAVTSNGTARFAPYLTGDFEGFRAQHKLKISTGALCVFTHDGASWHCDGWNVKPKDHLG